MLNYNHIDKNDLVNFQKIFTKMNQISNPKNPNYIQKQSDKYLVLAKEFKMNVEKIRKLFIKTWSYKSIKYQGEKIKIKYYDCHIFLNNLNKENIKKKMLKDAAQKEKYARLTELIKLIVKNTNKIISAKTISSILKIQTGIYYSPKHIYHLVKNKKLEGLSSNIFPVLGQGKYQKTVQKPTKRQVFCSIDDRPEEINKRIRLGDLEVDTIEGQKGDKFNIATTIDRRSRRVATSIYEGKDPAKFAKAIANNIRNLNVVPLSITADNGVENHQLKTLQKEFPTIENIYSTHSYAGWEKGTVEQKNKQFRKFKRKGQSMDNLTQFDCNLISLSINSETYLQNSKQYKLNEIVTEEELKIYLDIIWGKRPELTYIFQLKNIVQKNSAKNW